MNAVVEIKGKQYRIEKGSKILVDYLGAGEEGADAEAPEIKTLLLKKDDDSVMVGKPYLTDVTVSAKVLGETKGDKILVFKYKKRKDHHKTRGHRQKYHEIMIEDITA